VNRVALTKGFPGCNSLFFFKDEMMGKLPRVRESEILAFAGIKYFIQLAAKNSAREFSIQRKEGNGR